MLLGKYEYALSAVVHQDFVALAILAAGAVAGILGIARLLRWMFHRYHDLTVAALIGLMLGSLRKIWPWKEIVIGDTEHLDTAIVTNIMPEALTADAALTSGLAILGFVLVVALDFLAHRRKVGGESPGGETASLSSITFRK